MIWRESIERILRMRLTGENRKSHNMACSGPGGFCMGYSGWRGLAFTRCGNTSAYGYFAHSKSGISTREKLDALQNL